MAITPSQWSHVLTIPESYTPSAATSGQTLVITESVIAKLSAGDQTTFWTNVENGGGDVRICESSDGTNQLPVEVVSLDNVAKTCVIWTRKPTYAGTGSLYLFFGKAGETKEPDTGAFGRNAVWVDYDIALPQLTTPLVNSADGSLISVFGSPATVTSGYRTGLKFDNFKGASALIYIQHGVSYYPDFTQSITLDTEPSASRQKIASLTNSSESGSGVEHYIDSNNDTRSVIDNSGARIVSTSLTSGISILQQTNNSTTASQIFSVNGVWQSGTGSSSPQLYDKIFLGRNGSDNQQALDGIVYSYFLRKSASPSELITTEYANQNDPSTFYGTPTLASTGGGGTGVTLDANVTLPSLTATGNASATLPQAALSASIYLTQLSATGSASATLPNPELSANIALPILTVAGIAAASLPNPALSASITLPTITVSGNASATLPGFNLSGNITLPAITATGAAQATLPQPILTATVNLPTLTATGSATATEPSFTLSGNVTLPTITATGTTSATLPQPTLSGNITLPSIQVSGFLVGGEIVITIDASTNITEPTLSTNITEPTLSTNISE